MASANRQRERLTPRQREVWELLRQGLTNEEIAVRLGISPDGVKYHVGDILRRLDVPNRYEAALWEPASDRRGLLRALLPLPFLGKLKLNTLAYAAGGAVIAATLAGVALLTWAVVSTNSGTVPEIASDDPPDALTYVQDGAIWQADGTGDPQRLFDVSACGENFPQVEWSPRGDRLSCGTRQPDGSLGFVIWDANGRLVAEKKLGALANVFVQSWSPSGVALMYLVGDRLTVVDDDGELMAQVSGVELRSGAQTDLSDPLWSEDGSLLAYWSTLDDSAHVVYAGFGERLIDRLIPELNFSGRPIAWVLDDVTMLVAENYEPPVEDLAFPSYEVWLVDTWTGARERRPELDNGVQFWLDDNRKTAAFLVQDNADLGLRLLDLESGRVTPIAGSSINYPSESIPAENVRFSDDGRYLYWLDYDTTTPNGLTFWRYDRQSGALDPIHEGYVWIAPDGRRISYSKLTGESAVSRTLFLAASDGSNAHRVTTLDDERPISEITWRSQPSHGATIAQASPTPSFGSVDCGVTNDPLCALAAEMRDGLNASDPSVITDRLYVRPFDCVADYPGCDGPDDTSEPLVDDCPFASDSCGKTREQFADDFSNWIESTERSEEWRIESVNRGPSDAIGATWLLFAAGTLPDDPVLHVDLLQVDGYWLVPGIMRGPRSLAWPPIASTPASPTPSLSLAGCPVDDDALCQFAVDVQAALNAGDISLITDRLVTQERPCNVTFSLVEDDIGCESPDDTSDPVVEYFNYGSDCCFKTPEQFAEALREWLDQTRDGQWRIESVMDDIFLNKDVTNLMFTYTREGTVGQDDPVITVRVQPADGQLSVRGITKGVRATRYVPPEAEVLPWQWLQLKGIR